MKGNGSKESLMGMVYLNGLQEKNMMETGKILKSMGMEYL